MNSLQLILLGLGILVAAFMLRRSAVLARRCGSRDPASELRRELREFEQSGTSQIQRLEVRLHDYGREVEGRIETNLALLDGLLAEADEEIVRLETLLEETRREHGSLIRRTPDILAFSAPAHEPPAAAAGRPLAPEHRRMIVHLAGAGYRGEEIARLLDRPLSQIEAVLLGHGDRPEAGAA